MQRHFTLFAAFKCASLAPIREADLIFGALVFLILRAHQFTCRPFDTINLTRTSWLASSPLLSMADWRWITSELLFLVCFFISNWTCGRLEFRLEKYHFYYPKEESHSELQRSYELAILCSHWLPAPPRFTLVSRSLLSKKFLPLYLSWRLFKVQRLLRVFRMLRNWEVKINRTGD